MKELIAHIESLLLTNDCVIVPNFGGFITFRLPAKWIEEQQSFIPPARTIGFNPQLLLNDGLLVQSYMNYYGTSFPDANKRVMKAVRTLKKELYANGKIDLSRMGTLRMALDGTFHFTPYIDGLASPTLYGLKELHILPFLAQKEESREPVQKTQIHSTTPAIESHTVSASDTEREHATQPETNQATPQENTIDTDQETTTITEYDYEERKYLLHHAEKILRWGGSVAAAILFFLWLSAPIKNILPNNTDKAQVISSRIFEAESLTKQVAENTTQPTKQPKELNEATIQKAPNDSIGHISTPKAEPRTVVAPALSYYIVVGALTQVKNADSFCAELKEKGYEKACVISGSRMQKICIDHATNEEEATELLRKYRETYSEAWILHHTQP